MQTKLTTNGRPPKVILFDLWRTLAHSLDKEPILDVQRILGHNMQFMDGGHYRAELDPEFLRVCLTTNIKDPERFLHHIAGRFGKVVPPDGIPQFEEILRRERHNLALYNDVERTLTALKELGFDIGLISNLWGFPEEEIFHMSGFGGHFSHRIYSFEVGARKPEPEIFIEACKRFGVQPNECLMVGDHPEADVKGAMSVGMNAVLIDRPGELRQNAAAQGMNVITTLLELVESFRSSLNVEGYASAGQKF
jgi:HAD superfamily hydrolase (TIGR01509 family)